MQQVTLPEERNYDQTYLLGSGTYRYRLDTAWAQWAPGMERFGVTDACCGPDDTIYCAVEDAEHPICILDREGHFVRSFGKGLFEKPHGISLTQQGTLLVADTGLSAHVVRELTVDGELVRDFGTLGKPCANGYNTETVRRWYADKSWEKQKRLFAALDLIQEAGQPFCRPTEMIQAKNGRYYASDGYGNCAVQCFAPDGSYLGHWGAPGHGPGEFYLVHSLAEDPLGRIWVADRENRRVQIYTQEGELVAVMTGGFMKVASLWCDGSVMFIGEQGGVSVVDMDLKLIARFGDGGSLLRNNGMCGDSHGNLYICSHFRGPNGQGLLRLERQQ